jgi:eukaryotic-like serine/threonine-protein kinase
MDPREEHETIVTPNVDGPEAATVDSTPVLPSGTRYDVRTLLGRGGMAAVYLAFDHVLMREVALKTLGQAHGVAPDLERFVGEAQITAQLDHPNIVPVHDLVLFDEHPYFVMKLLGGRTLGSELHQRGGAPRDPEALDELLGIFLKVCDAVAFAHSRGVVHRDLKPDNVMVDTFGRVYVMDWGLARVVPGSEAARIVVTHTRAGDDGSGTVMYMAPEQARPAWRPIGPWTDVFALGAILYEILTGRPPHTAPSSELRDAIFNGEIIAPDVVVPGGFVPAGLARITMTALAREPQHRYGAVQDMKRDVERFLRGSARWQARTFAPGELVVREGDTGEEAFVITQGRCVAYKTIDGERFVLREMGPGDVFGEMAVFSSRARTATVEALETLRVHAVSREALSEGLGLDTWMGAFVRTVADRFREKDEKLTQAELEIRRLTALCDERGHG